MDRHTRLQALTTVHHSPLSDTSIARREDTYQARSITEISHRSGEVTSLGICPSEVLSHGELRGCSIVRNHQNMGWNCSTDAGHIAETGPSTAPASASALLAPMANSTTLRASMMVPSPWVTQ